jgi:hypothetical protein
MKGKAKIDTKQLESEVSNLEGRKADLAVELAKAAALLGEAEAERGKAVLAGEDAKNEKKIADLKGRIDGLQFAIRLIEEELFPLRPLLAQQLSAEELQRTRAQLNRRIRLLVTTYRRSLEDIEKSLDTIRGLKNEIAELSPLSKRPDLPEYRDVINSQWFLVHAWLQGEDVYTQTKIRRCFERLAILTTQIDALNPPAQEAVSTEEAQGDQAHK